MSAGRGYFVAEFADTSGLLQTNVFYCDDLNDLQREIEALGGYLIRARRKRYSFWDKGFVNLDYKVRFLRALLTHIKSGQSSGRALALVIDSEEANKMRKELNPALEVLDRGGDFSQALEHMRIFDRTVISILRGGESVGDIGKAVEAGVRYLRSLREAQNKLLLAIGALGFDLLAAFSSIGFLQYIGLPWLEQNGMKQGSPEKIAAFKAAVANAYLANGIMMWGTILVCATLAAIIAAGVLGGPALRLLADRALLRVPLLRSLFIHRAIADTFGIVAVMVSGRVNIDRAINTAKDATPVPTVAHYWDTVLRRMSNGVMPSTAMKSDMLMRSEVLAITNSPDTNGLAATLLEISTDREQLAKESADTLIQWAIAIAMFYVMAIFGIGFYVLDVQGTGMDAMMDGALGGGF